MYEQKPVEFLICRDFHGKMYDTSLIRRHHFYPKMGALPHMWAKRPPRGAKRPPRDILQIN